MSYKILFDSLQEIEKVSLDEESSTKFAFNIFSILRKSDDEVGLHSKFLAEMLNPYGSHAIPAFQKLFIDEVINTAVDSQEWQNKKLDSSIVYSCRTEMFIRGFGRVDIVLFSSENIIVIENKINAEDQPKQLQRYFEACINLGYSSSKIYILYLNKSGVPITNHGKGNLRDEQFGRVNYKEDIIQWLDLCASEVKIYPHIEQNILQYKRLVSVLTGDNKSAKMKKSHIDLLYQDDNFKLAYELSQSFDGLQIDLQKKCLEGATYCFRAKGL